ncbi:MAG: HAD family phosphatase [Dehalococcoidia bacterium]|nr:HAD family phosphatase [Dehalococcoidia bacterium]MYK26031.1 HAD family phosphatase [Dehalococcoidia bacterium]
MSDATPFAAVIFDMDGVLVDGEPFYYGAAMAVLAEDGITFPLDDYKKYMGTKSGWNEFVHDLGLPRPASYYRSRCSALVAEAYASVETALPGAVELVRGLKAIGLPLAVASSSHRANVEVCLERLGIADAFDVIVAGNDITHGKPLPDIYLRAAGLLGVAPRDCLAIEDAPAGIQAAHAAGMTCWAVRTEYTRGLPLPDPDRDLESLTEIDLADIAGVPA